MIPNGSRRAHLKRAGLLAAKEATAMLIDGRRTFQIFGELRLRDMRQGAGEIGGVQALSGYRGGRRQMPRQNRHKCRKDDERS